MLKEYIFRVLKDETVRVVAENEEDAFVRAEELSIGKYDEVEIRDIELIEVIGEDVDAKIEERKMYSYGEGEFDS